MIIKKIRKVGFAYPIEALHRALMLFFYIVGKIESRDWDVGKDV